MDLAKMKGVWIVTVCIVETAMLAFGCAGDAVIITPEDGLGASVYEALKPEVR